jgi:YHS domain-containing protein
MKINYQILILFIINLNLINADYKEHLISQKFKDCCKYDYLSLCEINSIVKANENYYVFSSENTYWKIKAFKRDGFPIIDNKEKNFTSNNAKWMYSYNGNLLIKFTNEKNVLEFKINDDGYLNNSYSKSNRVQR